MISIIIPYPNPKVIHEAKKIEGKKEILVPAVYGRDNETRRLKAETLEEFIEKSFRECRGDKILFLGGSINANTMKRMAGEDADIVYLNRKKHSSIAKFFIHLILPFSRKFTDPLTQIFLIKRKVIEGIDIKPVEKMFIEIIARGRYESIKEIKSDAKTKFRDYRKNSKYVFRLAQQHGELTRFAKFGIVGLSSLIVNEFVLWILLFLGLIPAGIIAIEAGTLFAFTGNDIWTFGDRRKKGIKKFLERMGKYHLFSFIAVMINLAVLVLLVNIFSFHPLTANIIGMACAFTWNFITNNFIVWSI